jgi:hypothetical protein
MGRTMKTRRETTTGLSRTATLLLVAYLDVAILGGIALIAHWTGDSGQVQRSQAAEDCPADRLTKRKTAFNESGSFPDAIGSESGLSRCYNDRTETKQ